MSLTIAVTSTTGFSADLAPKVAALLRDIGVEIEVYPHFTPATWEGGFLPVKVLAMPRELVGVAFASPILSGVEIDFDGGVASLRSPASRSAVDCALFCLSAAAIAKVTGGRLEMDGVECPLSPEKPFSGAIETIESFVAEASESDLRQTPFVSWEAVE
jgi:hypothetical protein